MSDPRLDESLAALDRALAARPHRDGQAFTEATKPMCAYRDELRYALRKAPDDLAKRRQLKAANLAVTLMLAGHFPLGDMPWDQIEALRGHLEAMQRDAAA
ncbi:hypothetical protein [Caulobacter sp. S45]|uniref:hypothetical protein n=1 Tax=Caulobacter sp. S45 TaxID=1641861 RepID=UPI00157710D1|nr:hypothetical protein [Caulobacter sp. S45]